MNTPYSDIIFPFFKRIEEDKNFFNYIGVFIEEANLIAIERAKGLLREAVGILMSLCEPDVDFFNYDDANEAFGFELTGREKYLLISLMYQQYLERDIAKLKLLDVNYTPTNLRVFDPNAARTSFMSIYKFICEQNEVLIDEYKNKDRLTGKYRSINYPSYDESDE